MIFSDRIIEIVTWAVTVGHVLFFQTYTCPSGTIHIKYSSPTGTIHIKYVSMYPWDTQNFSKGSVPVGLAEFLKRQLYSDVV